jgi:glycosyltransferase involved in cell wall biosynthesis
VSSSTLRVSDSASDLGSTVAIVHDYLTQRGGAERVVLTLCRAFPDAPVYASLYAPEATFPEFRQRDVRPLWLDRIVPFRRRHRLALPLLPVAFSTSSVEADVVVCSTSGWAHGIRTQGRKIAYCYSPAKWLYRRDDYLGEHPSTVAGVGLRVLDPFLRRFDRRSAAGAERYIAISTFIASQIREVYGIHAEVLCPPPGVGPQGASEAIAGIEPGFVLTVARLLPYKNVGQVVEAFRRLPELSLIVVGDGPDRARLTANAPANVRFLAHVDDEQLRWLYANCIGLVAASREDYGLTPLEAACFGKPVAALRWGGFLDTVVPDVTGLFFDSPEAALIARAVKSLMSRTWDTARIVGHVGMFSEARFIERMRALVGEQSAV